LVKIRRHDAWPTFARDAANVAAGYSQDDLFAFRHLAQTEYPALVPIIDGYIDLITRSETGVVPRGIARKPEKQPKSIHLFDLLREKTFFPQNLDLARFAARVLPGIKTYRFDKMSRGDIAARIIEHIEASEPKTKDFWRRQCGKRFLI
jgi:hypothetical protein